MSHVNKGSRVRVRESITDDAGPVAVAGEQGRVLEILDGNKVQFPVRVKMDGSGETMNFTHDELEELS